MSNFKNGDVVQNQISGLRLLVIDDGTRGVLITPNGPGVLGLTYPIAGGQYVRVKDDYTAVFKARHEPRWRKGDVFEVRSATGHLVRSFATSDDYGGSLLPPLAGIGLTYGAGSNRAIGKNIYDL